jgi:hypothetical protein
MEFVLGISGFMRVGKGLSEVSFKEVPKLLIVILDAHGDSGIKKVQLVFLPWLHCVTSHISESCGDMGVEVGHGFIMTISCFEEVKGN